MSINLPRHPVTGLRALGIGRRGPIWPQLGGDGTGDGNTGDDRRSAPTLTHSQSVNRLREIQSELERLAEFDELTPEDERYFETLTDEFGNLDSHRKRLERSAELARVRSAATSLSATGLRTERGSIGPAVAGSGDYDRDAILEPDSVEDHRFRNPWDMRDVRTFGRSVEEVGVELRARALSAIEKMQGANDDVRDAATRILERFDDKRSTLARQVLATSSPAYLRAWSRLARNQQHLLTAEEQQAINEVRGMSLTDTAGGFLVPFQLDPVVINTAAGSKNDIRQYARQVVATGDKWHGVSAGNVSWSWDAEGAEVSDDAPTFAQPTIDIFKAQGFVPITIEALEDEQNVTAAVAELLAGGKDDLEAVALITGNGTTQPKGVITALDGTAAEIAPATPETFALADVYGTYDALPARYRARASWLANNLIYSRIRQFDTAGGAGLWTTVGEGRPGMLNGRPVGEAEAMDGTINAAATADNFVLLVGDFSHYIIADRIGMTVEFIPHLFHTGNNRPSGQRGWYAHARMGADISNANAFRLLNVATTA